MGQVPNPIPNQAPNPVTNPTPVMGATVEQGHASGVWYAALAIVVVALALGLWYFFAVTPVTEEQPAETQASNVEETQIPALTGGNTTADISADLNQVPDTSAALDADAAASANAISGL